MMNLSQGLEEHQRQHPDIDPAFDPAFEDIPEAERTINVTQLDPLERLNELVHSGLYGTTEIALINNKWLNTLSKEALLKKYNYLYVSNVSGKGRRFFEYFPPTQNQTEGYGQLLPLKGRNKQRYDREIDRIFERMKNDLNQIMQEPKYKPTSIFHLLDESARQARTEPPMFDIPDDE